MKTIIAISILLGAVTAIPAIKPRTLDIAGYKAVPTVAVTGAPFGNTVAPTLWYNPASATPFAVASPTTVSSSIARDSVRRDESDDDCPAVCAALPAGNGPSISNPDGSETFQESQTLSDAALDATTPTGYVLVEGFQNVDAAAEAATYLTYISDSLTSYDPSICANACNEIQGCNSFNIYFERDPTVQPDEDECPNPPSQTIIKCALFGGFLDALSATNFGQWQAEFNVVIAGSNAYNSVAPRTIPRYNTPENFGDAAVVAPFGDAAVNAPANTTTYMGIETFPQTQPYDPAVCAATCNAKSNPDCAFFVSYILYKNGLNGVFTCTYFTVAYGPDRAIERGQYDGEGNHYTIGHSFGFSVV